VVIYKAIYQNAVRKMDAVRRHRRNDDIGDIMLRWYHDMYSFSTLRTLSHTLVTRVGATKLHGACFHIVKIFPGVHAELFNVFISRRSS